MKLLDLFCGAGGAAMGYSRAGFAEIVGVDIKPMPRYPFTFVQGDALEYVAAHGHEFDAIHASPPCQRWSEATPLYSRGTHPDLIAPTREACLVVGAPYVIENVDGARRLLKSPLLLCGTMFGLRVWRHRWFEAPSIYKLVPQCVHIGRPVIVSGSGHGRGEAKPAEMITALDVSWMGSRAEARQAIPPAYTEFIGKQLIQTLRARRKIQ